MSTEDPAENDPLNWPGLAFLGTSSRLNMLAT